MTKIKKIAITSFQMIIAIGIVSIFTAFVRHGVFSFIYVFRANFGAGAVVFLAGLVTTLAPVRFSKDDKLIDHSTYVQRMLKAREEKRIKAFYMMYTGISIILITAFIQLLISYVI